MKLEAFFQTCFKDSMPCSFTYDGKPTSELFGPLTKVLSVPGSCEVYERRMEHEDGKFTAVLKVRLYPTAVEWWLELSDPDYFDSAMVESIAYADLTTACVDTYHGSAHHFPRFTWAHGSLAQENDFEPVEQELEPEHHHTFRCNGGYTSSGVFPYFNLQNDRHNGLLLAIGWNGQWRVDIEKLMPNPDRPIRFRASMEYAAFRVKSGEVLELPHMIALPWVGEMETSFNTWRRFVRDFILPRYDGKPLQGNIVLRTWGGLDPEVHRAKLENAQKHNLGAELYQIDAGWHGDETTPKSNCNYFDSWFKTVGIWKPLPYLYPNGLEGLNRDCHDAGLDLCVWFEPERMPSHNRYIPEHPEFFIGSRTEGSNMMLNIGDPAAREWILETLDKVIEESGLSVFRIDFNYQPLTFWQYNDAPDRKGITEIKYVNGVYTMYDELLRRHPGLKIDNCASGGRRLDYRMFRRSMPMICRSDYFCWQDNLPEPKQCHTYGLSLWCPAHADSLGSCIGHTPEVMDSYRVRSTMCSGIGMTAPWWPLSDEEADWYRKTFHEARVVRRYASCDFYGLTGYTRSAKDWMAWQFHDPDAQSGVVMAFRHEENATPVMYFALKGLEESALYTLCDSDKGEQGSFTGKELSEGLRVSLPEKRSSAIIEYQKA